MKQSKFHKGWDEDCAKRVVDHYENQTEDEAVAEDEAAWEDTSHTFIEVPNELKYLLIGPGRWGSADRWLGIPVNWNEICGVGAIIETTFLKLKADPSQGSHFFHNITTLGINYISISEHGEDFLNWEWLTAQPAATETSFVAHVKLDKPFTLKVDGRKSQCVMFMDRG